MAALAAGCGGGGGGSSSSSSSSSSTTTAPAPGALPRDFVGVVAAELLGEDPGSQRQTLEAMHNAGVRLVRQTFDWATIEPRPGHYDFTLQDGLVGAAARAGVHVLPVVFHAPAFAAASAPAGVHVTATTSFAPRSPVVMAHFATVLVKRYGPAGSFWRSHPGIPRRPITTWQVWNEPNLPAYWGGRPDAKAYVALLRAVGAAIRAADPQAQVLTAGLPDSRLGVPLLRFVRQMYAAGARGTFDTLAVHPYATSVAGVLVGARAALEVATKAGDGDVRLWITEAGWASGGPGSDFTVSYARQAQLVSGLVRQAAAQAGALHLQGVVIYSWRDVPPYAGGQDFWGLHTGMVKRDNSVKPALTAFAAAAKGIGEG